MKPWNAAIYIRTSKGVEEEPGNTLGIQLGIIMDYLNKEDDIELYTVKIDNGRTGLNFNRPAFRDMMDEVEAGLVNCIIVKDLSRLSRNHLDASDMLFREFAAKNIRFIAVQDKIDLLYLREDQRDFFIPFRTLMNQIYSLDLSKKISCQLKVRRDRGEYIGSNAVYGSEPASTRCGQARSGCRPGHFSMEAGGHERRSDRR